MGDIMNNYTSFFMVTWQMYFLFLMCEVKCGAVVLDIADQQNAYSMTITVRAIVELFRLIKYEQEINQEILAFLISHNYWIVRIYGHYPMINEKDTTFYYYPIHTFDFIALDSKDKQTAYKFIKSIYNIWVPIYFKRICLAINQIPFNMDFNVSELDLQFS